MTDKKTIDGIDYTDLSARRDRYDHLIYLRKQKRLIEQAIDVIEAEFAEAVLKDDADGVIIDGLPVITYKQDGTFPFAKYAAANPHIAAECMVTKTVFSVDELKRLFPQEYLMWRPRSFKIVNKKG